MTFTRSSNFFNFSSFLWISSMISSFMMTIMISTFTEVHAFPYTPCPTCDHSASPNDLANISLRLYQSDTLDDYTQVFIGEAKNLIDKIDSSKPTVMYISGWTETTESESVFVVLGAYLKLRDHNVILVNYEHIAVQMYVYVLLSANGVGFTIAKGLKDLENVGFNLSKLHIVSHSMGSQIAGYVGRYVDNPVARITGLDPAGPGFEYTSECLSSKDAEFVVIVHTDSGYYGSSSSCKGHVNFYPNGGKRLQPGCQDLREPFGTADFCDHHRSWFYYAESLLMKDHFIGIECKSYTEFTKCNCNDNSTSIATTVTMSDKTPNTARGNFYLQTNSESPFGRGKDGIIYKNTSGFSITNFLSNFNYLLKSRN